MLPERSGETGDIARALDWTGTPLGPPERWPQPLRTAIAMMLGAASPVAICWGPERVFLYNDACRAIAGDRHPVAFGRPAREALPDTWPEVEPMFDGVLAGRGAVRAENALLPLRRGGRIENAWFSFSINPIPLEDDSIGGAFALLSETTAHVLAGRRAKEVALRESGARSQRLVEGVADATWETDADGALVEPAASWRAMTGQTADECLGRGWLDAIHPEDRGEVERCWRESVATGRAFDAEFRLRYAAGGFRWVDARAVPLAGPGGRIAGWLGMTMDIHARRTAEARLGEGEIVSRAELARQVRERTAELAQSRDLLRATMDASMDMIQVFEAVRDETGTIVDFRWLLNNHAAERRFGNVIGRSLLAANPGVVAEGIFDSFRRVVETGVPERSERHYVHEQFDGWFYQSAVKLGDGVATTTTDITERKSAELELLRLKDEMAREALRESEARYRTLFASMDEGFCTFDVLFDSDGRAVDFRFIEANPAFVRHTGLSDAAGRRMRELVPDHEEEWFEVFGRIAVTGEPVSFELRARALGDRWLEVHGFRVGDPALRRVAAIFQDVSGRKRAENALRESEERQAFLLRLGDTLRGEPDADAIAMRAAGMLAAVMGLDRCAAVTVDLAAGSAEITHQVGREDLAPLPAFLRLSDFPQALRRTFVRTLVLDDAATADGLDEAERHAIEALGHRALVAPAVRRGAGNPIWSLVAASVQPRHWTAGEVALVEEVTERTWAAMERARAEEALRDSEARFRALIHSTSNVVYRMSPDWAEMRRLDGRGFLVDAQQPQRGWMEDYILPEDRAHVTAIIREAIRTRSQFNLEHRVLRADGSIGWVHSRAVPIVGNDGEIREWFGAANDVTGRKRAEEHQTMLMAELDHRVKNVLAVVQSIARQTLGPAGGGKPDAPEKFIGRLSALAQSHRLLARSRWEGAGLRDLVENAVAPHRGESGARIVLDGPDLRVTPKAAQTLTLALHELVTNAAKYGALSRQEGRVTATWEVRRVGTEDRIVLDWREEGGPEVVGPPGPDGFGSRLIQRAVAFDLGGRVALDFAREGLRALLEVPLKNLEAAGGDHPPAPLNIGVRPAAGRGTVRGRHILLVEDELLVADDMAATLRSAGAVVIGPVATLRDAMHHVATGELDGAVLDINLGGEFVWPAAETLRARRIPFLFATSYSRSVEPPPELADAEWIEKPTEPRRLITAVAALLAGG